jgi:hypothetical protein
VGRMVGVRGDEGCAERRILGCFLGGKSCFWVQWRAVLSGYKRRRVLGWGGVGMGPVWPAEVTVPCRPSMRNCEMWSRGSLRALDCFRHPRIMRRQIGYADLAGLIRVDSPTNERNERVLLPAQPSSAASEKLE